jgi:hypothetical protein
MSDERSTMIARVRNRLTYANVVATIALFVALGGSAVAAGVFDGHRIKGRSVPGTKLIRNSVTKNEVKESTLGKVPNADKVDSLDSKDFLRANAQAVDAAKFGGRDLDEFLRKDSAGRAFDSSQLGGLGPTAYRLTCPTGQRLLFSVCIESGLRPAAVFATASTTCANAGARLPTIAELEGARQLSVELQTDAPGEWSGNPASDTPSWWTIKQDGGVAATLATDAGPQYRCVFTPSG